MADLKKIKERIAEIAASPKNVQSEDIEWVVTHLGNNGHNISIRRNDHAVLFRVGGCQFGLCHHNRGSKQIKACYVKEFLDAMVEVGVYED